MNNFDWSDPRNQGLMTLAAGLLSQSGWQPQRVNIGQAFGQAGVEGMQAMRQAQMYNQQAAQQKVMQALHNANLQETQFKLDQQKALPGQLDQWNQDVGSIMGYNTPMGPVAQAPRAPGGSGIQATPVSPVAPGTETAPTVDVVGSQSQALYDVADKLEERLGQVKNPHPELEKRATAQIASIRARADRIAAQAAAKKPMVEHNYPVGDVNGIAMVQPHISLDQGVTWNPIPGSKPSPKFSSTPTARVEVNTGESFWKEFGRGQAKFLVDQQQVAQDASTAITVIHDMRKNLDKGAITGIGANAALNFGRALSKAGFSAAQDPVANTQAYAAEAGNLVGQVIKQFGSGTGLSDADREYAKQIAAGDISLDEKSLRRLLDIREKANRVIVTRYNKRAQQVQGKAGSNLPIDIGVEEPPAYVSPSKEKYPTATNPKTGEKIEFRNGAWQPVK